MKQVYFFMILAFFILSSCRKKIALSSEEPMLKSISSISTNDVEAVPINFTETYFYESSVWNSCLKEFIDFSGTVHVEIRGMVSNNKITFVLHLNASNMKGVGRTTGTQYVTTSTFNFSNSFNFNTQFVYQQRATTRYVAIGSGTSFTVENDWHLTVTANGDVAFFFSTDGDVVKCQ